MTFGTRRSFEAFSCRAINTISVNRILLLNLVGQVATLLENAVAEEASKQACGFI